MTGNPGEKRAAGAGNDGSSREERGSLRRMPGESAKGEEKLRALESKFTMDPAFCNSFFLFVENDEDGGKETVLESQAKKRRGTDTRMTENIK